MFNFNELKNYQITYRMSRVERFDMADKQADIVIKELYKHYPASDGWKWEHVEGNSYINLTNGDIRGYKNGILKYNIDLKTAEYNTYGFYGPISINSIINFANNPTSWYLCTTYDGSKYRLLYGMDVYIYFMTHDGILYKSYNHDDYIVPYLNKYIKKVRENVDGVSREDYLGTTSIKKIKYYYEFTN